MIQTSRVPTTDLSDKPPGKWSDSVIQSLNDTMFRLTQSYDNIEFKQIQVVVPDPWVKATLINTWAGKGDTVYFAKLYDGSCQIRGNFIGGTPATIAFRLPQQCLPAQASGTTLVCSANSAFGTISINGSGDVIPFIGASPWVAQSRFMCLNNRPAPLSCFPINVQTAFKTPPKAVVAISNYRMDQDRQLPTRAAQTPQWRYIKTAQGPTVQITDIAGLEYGCKQKILLAIIGG